MRFVHESFIPASPEEVFAFHRRPDALNLLLPPFDRTEVVRHAQGLETGNRTVFRTRVLPGIWMTVEALHTGCRAPEFFEDTMERGPFRFWRHRHLFIAEGNGCRLRDEIDYEPPLGAIGRLVGDPFFIRPRLRRMFVWRHEVTRREVL